MKKHFRSISSLLILVALLILPYFVFAASTSSTLGTLSTVASQGGYQAKTTGGDQGLLSNALGKVIAGALSLLGAIFIILVIIGGYLWMTAGGNEQKTAKAQSYIKQAIIGLIITLSTWAIWSFLIKKLVLK